ncbi:MAG TPA: M13 family metallopeptidase [Longimicrobium sp.]|nr:M13 family metallopeptidase [Longimicrobium sp.]
MHRPHRFFRAITGFLAAAGIAMAVPSAVAQQSSSSPATLRGRGIDPAHMDTTCKACSDFYRYANGGWLTANPIPADRSGWSSYDEAGDRTTTLLHQILEDAARKAPSEPGTLERKLGTFYAACMDSTRAEAEGVAPVAADLARIEAVRDRAGLLAEMARLQRQGTGIPFAFFSAPDDRDASRTIAVAWQSGLTLPSREYYLREDSAARAQRAAFRDYAMRMFVLAGVSEERARQDADRVIEMETSLARAALTPLQMRDPAAVYHMMSIAELQRLTPHFDWAAHLRALGAPAATQINAAQPEYLREFDRLLASAPLEQWQAYLRWRVLSLTASSLSSPFADASFRFNAIFSGARQRAPRWRRCVNLTSDALGPALGRVYGQRVFTPVARARAQEMIANLRAVMRERIEGLEWMGPQTRAKAIEKLDSLEARLGYPDRIPDYSRLQLPAGSFLPALRAVATFERGRDWARIGQPTDQSEWWTQPQRVSGSYDPQANILTYPAAKFQPPFFDPEADDAVNYGALGSTIGHEIVHGFDDQGRQYDAAGNRRDWWTSEDAGRFEARAARLVAQYGEYVAVDTVHVNGRQTLGENIADLGGVTLSYYALQRSLRGKPRTTIDGLTPEQRFFISWAQNWRENVRDERLRTSARTGVHSPSRFRAIGPLSNMREFAQAFGCQPGDRMVRGDDVRVEIW